MGKYRSAKIALLASIAISCGPGPLPETYGLYALDGSKLIRLSSGPDYVRLSRGARFIAFDKIVGSGVLGSGAISLDELVQINKAAFVRFEVERVKNLGSDKVSKINLSRVNASVLLNDRVPLEYGPVEGRREMLLISSPSELSAGLYSLRFNDISFRFTIGIPPSEVPFSPDNRCQDRYLESRSASRGFSWADWISRTQGSGKTTAGNWLEGTGYRNCSALDNEAEAWLNAATTAIARKEFAEALGPAMLLASYDSENGGPLLLRVSAGALEAAQGASRSEDWKRAADLARVVLEIDSNNGVAADLARTADQRVAENVAAERAAAQDRLEARIRESQAATTILGSFTVLSSKVSSTYGLTGNDRHPIEVTDVGVNGLAYLSNSGWITSTGDLSHVYWFCWIMKPAIPKTSRGFTSRRPAAELYFRNFWDWWAVFETEEERDRFIDVVNSARDRWYERYGDLVIDRKCPAWR